MVVPEKVIGPEPVSETPKVDRYTGKCCVCGMKDAHQWRCIIWFIQNGINFYRKNLIEVRGLLKEIELNHYVTTKEVTAAIEKLNYIEHLHESAITDR